MAFFKDNGVAQRKYQATAPQTFQQNEPFQSQTIVNVCSSADEIIGREKPPLNKKKSNNPFAELRNSTTASSTETSSVNGLDNEQSSRTPQIEKSRSKNNPFASFKSNVPPPPPPPPPLLSINTSSLSDLSADSGLTSQVDNSMDESDYWASDADIYTALAAWDETGALQRRSLLTELINKGQLSRWSRLAGWCRIGGAHLARTGGFNLNELVSKSDKQNGVPPSVLHRINKDMPRTKCNDVFETLDSSELQRLLVAYAYLDKEVGYVQGMNFVAALCIAHAEEQVHQKAGIPHLPATTPIAIPNPSSANTSSTPSSDSTLSVLGGVSRRPTIKGVASSHMHFNLSASQETANQSVDPLRMAEAISHADSCTKIDGAFLLFTRMMQASGLRRIFDSKDDYLHVLLTRLNWHLSNIMPDLHEHLEIEQVSPAFFAVEWFTTLYIYNVSYDTASTIFGLFLLQGGLDYMVTIGLAYLFHLKDKLMQLSFDTLPTTLKQLVKGIKSEELIFAINNLYVYCSDFRDYTKPDMIRATTSAMSMSGSTSMSSLSPQPLSSSANKSDLIDFWKLALKRPRWVPDNELLCCRNCRRKFTTMKAIRRHHCRSCGGVVCGACSRTRSPLPHLGYPTRVRVCAPCLSMGASVSALMLPKIPRSELKATSHLLYLCDLPSYCIEDLQLLSMKRWLPDDEYDLRSSDGTGDGGGGGSSITSQTKITGLHLNWFKRLQDIRIDLLSSKSSAKAKELEEIVVESANSMKQSIDTLTSGWDDLADFHDASDGSFICPNDMDIGELIGRLLGEICGLGKETVDFAGLDAYASKVILQQAFLLTKDFVSVEKTIKTSLEQAEAEALAPNAFRCVRVAYGYDSASFAQSIGESLISIDGGGGRSGAEFFLSNDTQFVIKSLPLFETTFLLELLPSYVEHVTVNAKHTLLPRFLGLFRVRFPSKKTWKCFVVMPNLFRSYTTDNKVVINEMYDLKGSIDARYVDVNAPEKKKKKKTKKNGHKKTENDASNSIASVNYDSDSSSEGHASDESSSDEGSIQSQSKEWDMVTNILRYTRTMLTFQKSKDAASDEEKDSGMHQNTSDVDRDAKIAHMDDTLNDHQNSQNKVTKKKSNKVLKDLNFCPFHGTAHASVKMESLLVVDDTDDASSDGRGSCLTEGSTVGSGNTSDMDEYSITGLHIRSKLKHAISSPTSANSRPLSRRLSAGGANCRKLRLGEDRRAVFLANLRNDTAWLRENNIMDYSLLLGVGTCQVKQVEEEKKRNSLKYPYRPSTYQQHSPTDALGADDQSDDDDEVEDDETNAEDSMASSWESSMGTHDDKCSYWETECGGVCATSLETNERVSILKESCGIHSVPIGLPGEEGFLGKTQLDQDEEEREWYTFSIIDILQKYDTRKQAEGFMKTNVLGKEGVSSVNPGLYSGRFVDYMEKHTM